MRRALLVLMICLLPLLSPGWSRSAEVHITPSLTAEEEYSDNYYRSSQNSTSVWATQLTPGINVEAFTDRSRLNVSYTLPYNIIARESGPVDASSDNYLGHNLTLFAATRPLSRMTVGLADDFLLTREPGSTDIFNDITSRDLYLRNRVSPFVGYDIAEKGEVKLSYRNEILSYLETTPIIRDDSTENRGVLTLTYHLNDQNHLDMEEQFWRREYTGTNTSYDSFQTMLIFRRELSSWLQAKVGGGYHWRVFDQSLIPVQDFSLPAFSMSLIGSTDRSKVSATYEHNAVDFIQNDAYFTADQVTLFFQRMFHDVFRGYVGGSYQYSQYEDSPRTDNTWNGYGGVGYSFLNNMFEVSIEYNRLSRDSNQDGFGYDENRVYLRLSTKYDFPKK